MRRFWIAASLSLAIVLAAVVGIWVGAIFRDSIANSLGVAPRRDKEPSISTAQGNSPHTNAGHDSTSEVKQWYGCKMGHPLYMQDHPGICPYCKMQLAPMNLGTTEMGTG